MLLLPCFACANACARCYECPRGCARYVRCTLVCTIGRCTVFVAGNASRECTHNVLPPILPDECRQRSWAICAANVCAL
eukprot:6172911-Pleurochrysis_carterae.AAC.1